MNKRAAFRKASPYQKDILGLPVTDIGAAAEWYAQHFGLSEVNRSEDPCSRVVMERDGVQIGFAINGGDPEQEGASILVDDVESMKAELVETGLSIGDFRIDDHDGVKHKVFFVVAPDGLCYYFHQPVSQQPVSQQPDG